jgi:hypothetical protein
MQTFNLADKKQFAKDRGYTLIADKNFERNTTVTMIEDSTGREYFIHWGSFRTGATPRITTLNQKRKDAFERGYILLGNDNPKTNDRVTLKNLDTGEDYTVKWADFLIRGDREKTQRVVSKGEATIMAYLETNLKEGYSFKYQEKVIYDESKKGFFDFSIRDYNDDIVAFIEYNGIQHYQVRKLFGEEAFNLTQESDRLKKEYAEQQGIPLLVIPYTVKDIADVVKEAFPEFTAAAVNPFKPKKIDNNHTSFEDKKKIAANKGWHIAPEVTENFTHMEKVKLLNVHTGEEWSPRWQDFIDGAKPKKAENQRRMKSTLEDKKQIATALGYDLLEKENFTVKKFVQLKVTETGETVTLKWEPIQAKYNRALKTSGIDL